MRQLFEELIGLLFASLASFLLPLISCFFLTRPFLGHPEKPWHERARLLWPARVTLSLHAILLPLIFAGVPILNFPQAQPWIHPIFIWLTSFLSVIYATFFAHRISLQRFSGLEFWKRWITDHLLYGLSINIIIISLICAEDHWTIRSWIHLALIVLLILSLVFGAGMAVGKRAGTITPGTPELDQISQAAAASQGVSPPATIIHRSLSAGAFAFPQPRTIGFADQTLSKLAHDEVAAIFRHELAHLSEIESRWTYLARQSAVPYYLFLAMSRPIIGTWGLFAWVVCFCLLAPITRFTFRYWRKMETRADLHAAQHDSADAQYARALERIHEINLIPPVLNKNSTHPDLYDRLLDLGVTPDYPRPEPPGTFASGTTLLVTCALSAYLAYVAPSIPWATVL